MALPRSLSERSSFPTPEPPLAAGSELPTPSCFLPPPGLCGPTDPKSHARAQLAPAASSWEALTSQGAGLSLAGVKAPDLVSLQGWGWED